jgi:hypothetical protein
MESRMIGNYPVRFGAGENLEIIIKRLPIVKSVYLEGKSFRNGTHQADIMYSKKNLKDVQILLELKLGLPTIHLIHLNIIQ